MKTEINEEQQVKFVEDNDELFYFQKHLATSI